MEPKAVEYWPPEHRLQEEAPKPSKYEPAEQFWQFVAPDRGLYWPPAQRPHAEAPRPVKYAPTVQFWHVAADTATRAVEYLPAPHSAQTVLLARA